MGEFADLAEHTGILVILIGIFATIAGYILYYVASTFKEDLFKMIGNVEEEIKLMREKQESLRSTLPKEYLRVDGPGYRLLLDEIAEIKRHLQNFTEDFREGRCPGGQK